jgi:hypothetical protein
MSIENLSLLEHFYLWVIRKNQKDGIKYIFNKHFNFKRLEITFEWRSKEQLWGRFGGGWNWELGFKAGERTIIFYFLIFYVVISIKRGNK